MISSGRKQKKKFSCDQKKQKKSFSSGQKQYLITVYDISILYLVSCIYIYLSVRYDCMNKDSRLSLGGGATT